MSDTPPMTPGTFGWNELVTTDTEACEAFFTELMGWTTDTNPMEEGGVYTFFKQGDRPVGGMMSMQSLGLKDVPSHWMAYLTVADVDASCARCRELGGRIVMEPMDVKGIGRFAIIADPSDAAVGLAQYFSS